MGSFAQSGGQRILAFGIYSTTEFESPGWMAMQEARLASAHNELGEGSDWMNEKRIEVWPPIQALAHALQNCFNEAVRQGAVHVDEKLEHVDKWYKQIDVRFEQIGERLDKKDATLRLIWKQLKGNGKLPIDA